jgi:rare lipoprotein A
VLRGSNEDAAGRTRSGEVSRGALKLAAALLVGLTAANCAGPQVAGGRGGNKYGVKPSPKVVPDGQPIPKGGGREMVGQPYVVGGRTYVPHRGNGYNREGWSSWYGTAFHGRLTANGEVFDRGSIAAAHPTLPLPSYVRVTNVVNRRSMVVRVNDRGPYEQGRLIDVSERVAEALDFRHKGVTRVRVEYLGKASTNGSDDAKLLATLKTDGTPAPFGKPRAPTMYADLRHAPAPRPVVARVEAEEPAETQDARAEAPAEMHARPGRTETDLAAHQTERPAVPVRVAAQPPAASDDDEVPLPPLRPAVSRQVADAATPMARAAVAPTPAIHLLPPQRPIYSGIY